MRHHVTQSGTVVAAAVGDEILVQLAERATSGYEWHVTPALPAGLEELPADAVPGTTPPLGIGAQNLRSFRFRVRSAGSWSLRFSQYRSWEGPSAAIENFEVAIRAAERS